MARLVPPAISHKAREKSRAEGKIFDKFKSSGSDENTVALHSLDFIEHEKKILGGECDFLVVFKGGIFALEVKGGGVGRDENSRWYTQNKEGRHYLHESPIEQVKDAIGSIKRWIKGEGLLDQFGKVVFGWAVIFPDVMRPQNISSVMGPGISERNIFLADDLDHDIQRFMNSLADYFGSKSDITTRKLASPEIHKVTEALRGSFSLDISPRYRLSVVEEFQIYATDQQLRSYEILMRGGNTLVTGGAGTGKTILASRFALKELNCGRSVLVLCFNRKLKDYLEIKISHSELLEVQSYRLSVMTIHGFLSSLIQQIGMQPPSLEENIDVFCDFAFEAVLSGVSFEYDRVILDEGQDYLTSSFRAVLDALQEQGHKFKWSWFLDPMIQASVFGRFDKAELQRLKMEADENYQNLLVNCRNTNQIRAAVDSIVGGNLREHCNIEGPVVDWLIADDSSPYELAKKAVSRYTREGLSENEIKIITLRSLKKTVLKDVIGFSKADQFVKFADKKIQIHTASSFKGLEAPGIIIVDVFSDLDHSEDWVKAVLYVAMTRATFLCSVITDRLFNESRIKANLSGGEINV